MLKYSSQTASGQILSIYGSSYSDLFGRFYFLLKENNLIPLAPKYFLVNHSGRFFYKKCFSENENRPLSSAHISASQSILETKKG